jgi:hypothetical protein
MCVEVLFHWNVLVEISAGCTNRTGCTGTGFLRLLCSVVDPDPLGSASDWKVRYDSHKSNKLDPDPHQK